LAKREIQKFKITSFQKKIIRRNPSLENVLIGRNEIKEETGFWKLKDELKRKKISEGGEAVIFTEKFGNLEAVVRIYIFDSFLFTSEFGANDLKWKTHLISGSFLMRIISFFFRFRKSGGFKQKQQSCCASS